MEAAVYKTILLPTDGSELAQNGVEHGLKLAKELGSQVHVITVVEPYPLNSPATAASWEEAQQRQADAALKAAQDAAAAVGVAVTSHIAVGESAADEIIKMAREKNCDLIIMASRGRRGLSEILLGSQTAKVVKEAHIPTLVVR